MFPVGKPQVLQAGVVAMAAHAGALPRHQTKLLLHDLNAAADRALVHGQGCSGLGLGARELEEIENVQIFQRRGWRVCAGGGTG